MVQTQPKYSHLPFLKVLQDLQVQQEQLEALVRLVLLERREALDRQVVMEQPQVLVRQPLLLVQ